MATGEQMRFRLPGWIILVLSAICFASALHLGSGVWGNPLARAWDGAMNGLVLGIIFFIHGLNTGPRRADVVVAACLLAGLNLADELGVANLNSPVCIVLIALAGIAYIRGSWIERRNGKGNAGSDNGSQRLIR